MTEDYKEYNNYSEKEKESMMAANSTTSNQNEGTLIAQTDQVEGLLGDILSTIANKLDTVAGKLDTIEGDLTTINSSVSGTTHEVTTQGQAIVQAIQGQ